MGKKESRSVAKSLSMAHQIQAYAGHTHMIIAVAMATTFPDLGNIKNNQLLIPICSMLPTKLTIGIHVIPAATADIAANIK
ncbi:hypothetical protein [Hymenobacter persicinus]|uniref:Uncharacterized protein n=1 Tax=Hymenobacter persicinus TaxID=2025506 RepID=A0A4Q5LCG9_9BACT|nr:hypothetical protein [Hymenobacter persicinus]RYU80471.1 hypothetical protein EWM57_08225 [Hymenobacter persicinus]